MQKFWVTYGAQSGFGSAGNGGLVLIRRRLHGFLERLQVFRPRAVEGVHLTMCPRFSGSLIAFLGAVLRWLVGRLLRRGKRGVRVGMRTAPSIAIEEAIDINHGTVMAETTVIVKVLT